MAVVQFKGGFPTTSNGFVFQASTGNLSIATGFRGPIPYTPRRFVEGDLLLMVVESSNGAISLDASWTAVTPQGVGTAGAATATRLSVFYRTAPSSNFTQTITNAVNGDHAIVGLFVFSPCSVVASAGSASSSTSTALTIPTITTPTEKCMVVHIVAVGTDVAGGTVSSFVNSGLDGYQQVYNVGTDFGQGGGLAMAVGYKMVAGATGTTRVTLSTGHAKAYTTLVLQGAGSQKTRRSTSFG